MRLVTVIAGALLGCVVACCLGFVLSMHFDSYVPSAIMLLVMPTGGAYVGGLRSGPQLVKIAAYAVLTWTLAIGLQPSVSRILKQGEPRIHSKYLAISYIPATLLATLGAGFAVDPRKKDDDLL